MLARLSIRDIVLIERLDIEFAAGLAVLTGETGAGKSILLDAFALALGARGDAGLVRHGAEQGQVTAAFELEDGHPACGILSEDGIVIEDPLLLRRVQLADGRTRAFVNDQPVSVQVLRSVGSSLVEIHGQHDERALVDPASHRRLLDAYGRLEPRAGALAATWKTCRAADEDLAAHRARVEETRRETEFLRHAVEELRTLVPEPGEEASLAGRRAAMMQAEKVTGDLHDAHELLAGSASPLPGLAASVRRLAKRAAQAPAFLEPAVKALDQVLIAIEEARAQIEHANDTVRFDPREIEGIEVR